MMNTFQVNIKDQCHSDLLMTEITIHIALSFILFLFIWTCACLMYYSCKSSHLENSYELSDLRRDHSFSTYGKCSEKLTFLTPWYADVRTCAYQEVRNVSFSEDFAYVLNEWSRMNCSKWIAFFSFTPWSTVYCCYPSQAYY